MTAAETALRGRPLAALQVMLCGTFMALAIGFFVTSLAAARIAARFGGAPISRGALLLAGGHLLQLANVGLGGDHVLAWMVPLLLVQGVGLGVVMAPLVSAVLAGLPPEHASVSSGVVTSVQQAGNALGVALIGPIFYGVLDATPAGHGLAFAASLAFLALSALGVAGCYALSRQTH